MLESNWIIIHDALSSVKIGTSDEKEVAVNVLSGGECPSLRVPFRWV